MTPRLPSLIPPRAFMLAVIIFISGCSSPDGKDGHVSVTYDDGNVVVVKNGDGEDVSVPVGPDTGTLTGTVLTDEGFRLAGARVTVWGAEKQATTDDKGWFQLPGVAPGKRLVRASHDAYIASEAEVEVKAGKVASLDLTLLPLESDPNFRPHAHDLFRGSSTYTVFDAEVAYHDEVTAAPPFLCDSDRACRYNLLQSEQGRIVPPGTAYLTFKVALEPGATFQDEKYMIMGGGPRNATGDSVGGAWDINGATNQFRLDLPGPGFTDHGHAQWSQWTFVLIFEPAWSEYIHVPDYPGAIYDTAFRSPVHVVIEAHKGALAVDPPHPKYWKDSDILSMPVSEVTRIDCGVERCEERTANPRVFRSSDSVSCASGGGTPGVGCLSLGTPALIPPGTTRIEFDLYRWYLGDTGMSPPALEPDEFSLGYKTAEAAYNLATWDDYTWLEPTGSVTPQVPANMADSYWEDGKHFVIDVTSTQTDPYYAQSTSWMFQLAIPGHEQADTWEDVSCKREICGRPFFILANFIVVNENRDAALATGEQ